MKKNNSLKEKQLGGVVAMLVTPFDKNSNVDYSALAAELDWCVENGATGIVVAPSIGEFAALSRNELEKCYQTCMDAAKKYPHLFMIAMTAAPYAWQVRRNAEAAKAIGYDAQQLIPPYYWVPDEEEIYKHYQLAAESALPIVVYHNPMLSKVHMSRDFIARLAKIPGVIALKETETALDKHLEPLFDKIGGSIKIFTTFWVFAAGLLWGSAGGFIHPFAMPFSTKMWELFQKGEYARMIKIQKALNSVFPRGGEGNLRHIGTTKMFASVVTGIPMGAPRAPYMLPAEKHEKKLREALPELFELLKDVR